MVVPEKHYFTILSIFPSIYILWYHIIKMHATFAFGAVDSCHQYKDSSLPPWWRWRSPGANGLVACIQNASGNGDPEAPWFLDLLKYLIRGHRAYDGILWGLFTLFFSAQHVRLALPNLHPWLVGIVEIVASCSQEPHNKLMLIVNLKHIQYTFVYS